MDNDKLEKRSPLCESLKDFFMINDFLNYQYSSYINRWTMQFREPSIQMKFERY